MAGGGAQPLDQIEKHRTHRIGGRLGTDGESLLFAEGILHRLVVEEIKVVAVADILCFTEEVDVVLF